LDELFDAIQIALSVDFEALYFVIEINRMDQWLS
jgi:hypothetical protein